NFRGVNSPVSFCVDEANLKALQLEAVEDKAPIQTKDAVLATLRELSTLSQTHQGKQRASLFLKLVTQIRGLKIEALGPAVPEMVEVSGPLTWQALAQCGTPECSSAILQVLSTMDKTAVEVDAAVYAMGLLPNPSNHLIQDVLSLAQHKPSKPILYALSNIVRRVYQAEGKVTPEIISVSEHMASLLGDCSGDKDLTFLALRVIGNMGTAMEAANPALKSALLQCMTQPAATPPVQQAAIQAFRKLTVTEEARGVLLQTVLDGASPIQKRVAAYLVLMKNPETADLAQVISALPNEQDPQTKSFVASHIANILSSTDPASLAIKQKITEALQGNDIPAPMDFTKFSRHYKMSNNLQGNVIFDSTSYMPKEVMLETTLKAFGYDLDVLEIGLDGKGLEPTVEALFGPDGFFPDTLTKALYWAGDKMPPAVNTILKNWLEPSNERLKRQACHT
ncbi:apolipoprotein B-100-like, partial [Megalops cyprinoides]|uniref:apolipoprotein B-100-like n=1 Tax=Megalops cyprinoides TaxID=118141 RepID=UPI001864F55D